MSRAFVDPNGCKVTLIGLNLFPVWKGKPAYSAERYQAIKAKGFSAVRFVLPWAANEPAAGQYVALEALDAAIALARNAGLYVILDTVHIDDWNLPPAWARRDGGSSSPRVAAIDDVLVGARGWIQTLAGRYANEPAVAAYDLYNEPATNDQNRVLSLYETLVGWVRAVDGEKVLLTNSGWGNTSMQPHFVDPAKLSYRRNVVHTYHDYYAGDGDPATTSHGYNEWGMGQGHYTWDGNSGYPNPADRSDFESQLQVQIGYARRAGIALWIGEYGIGSQATNASVWARQKTELYERYGLGRAWWLYACEDKFGALTPGCDWKPIVDELL